MMDKHSERDDVSMFFLLYFPLWSTTWNNWENKNQKKNRTGPALTTIATSVCVCAYVNTVQSAMRSHTFFSFFPSFLHSCPFSCGTRTTHSESGTISSTRRWERKERNWNDQCVAIWALTQAVPSARLHFISSEFKVDSIIGLTRRSNANGGYVLLTMRASTEINTHTTPVRCWITQRIRIFSFSMGAQWWWWWCRIKGVIRR